MAKTEVNEENLSESKKRKLEREKARNQEKKELMTSKIVAIVLGVIIVGFVIYGIVSAAVKNANKVEASSDYSVMLNDNGFVKNIKGTDCVTLPDYQNLTIPLSEVEYTDEEVDADIETSLSVHKVMSTDTDKAVEDGDKVNIDYVGSIDGVEFEGGNSGGAGYDLTIGSQSFIDTFEEQIIGHKVGDEFDVNVTFPEDYGKEELAGKPAVFAVTLHGIYVEPEFTDEFVAEYYSEYADSAEGYRAYLKDKGYTSNLREYVENYLVENTTAKSYPKAYLKNLKSVQKMFDLQSFDYMNQMSLSYYGYNMYQSFEEYLGMTEDEYDASLDDACKETEKLILTYQAILENEGVNVSIDDYKAYRLENGGTEESFDSEVESYGVGYTLQNYVRIKALEIVEGYAKVQ